MTPARVAVLLGATKGIGRATAVQLASEGWRVLVIGRDSTAGEALAHSLGQGASFLQADLSLMSSVRAVAARVRQLAPRVELIIHSADVLRSTRVDTDEGVELSFATNFLSRVLFNHLVLDLLVGGGSLVQVAAAGFPGRLELSDLPPQKTASAASAHNLGQRANDVYGLELAAKVMPRGVRVFVLHPGMVSTTLRQSEAPRGWAVRLLVRVLVALTRPFTVSPSDYAARLVAFLALAAAEHRSVLYGPRFKPIAPRRRFRDAAFRRAVWARAHALVGVSEEA